MNVDRLAHWYRYLEYCAFGRALERRRFAYLDRLKSAQTILILGEGDGRMLARLHQLAPKAVIDVVEISSEMITLARRRLGKASRVRFVQADARFVTWPELSYDAVITCFFLDCFSESEAGALIEKLARTLNSAGLWLMSDFANPEHGWRRWHAALWIWIMYRFFRLTTGLAADRLPKIEKLLTDAGLVRVERQEERAGMIVSEVWTKIQS